MYTISLNVKYLFLHFCNCMCFCTFAICKLHGRFGIILHLSAPFRLAFCTFA